MEAASKEERKKKEIQLRSERVRNIIGQVPSVFLRIGNGLIFISLLVLLGIGCIVKSPEVLGFKVQTVKSGKNGVLALVSNPAIPKTPLKKGCKVKLFKDGQLLCSGILSEDVDSFRLSIDKITALLPIEFRNPVLLPGGISVFVSDSTPFDCEVEVDNKPIINKLIPLF